MRGRTDKDVAIYAPGEAVTFQVQVFDGNQSVSGKKLRWTLSFDGKPSETGEEVVGKAGLRVTTRLDHPGFMRLQVKAYDRDGKALKGFVGGWGADKTGDIFFDGGASVQPDKLTPGEEPDDFDAFWQEMKAKGADVPMKADLRELPSPNPEVKLYAVRVSCAGTNPVTGYLSIPVNATPGSLPAVCNYQGYGVRKHDPPTWVNPNAIVFNVNAHGMDLGREDAYYEKRKKELSGYAFDSEENSDPKRAYFHDMALRVMRSLEYVKSLPEWNGRDLNSNGGSQGGLQAFWGTGLDPDVSACNSWSPWCCDLAGIQQGRMKGWRPDYTDALSYYDPVFHARRTHATVHLIGNFGDYTCPPSGVWMVYNQIPHDNKSIEMRQGCTHSYTMKPYMSFTMTPQGVRDVGLKEK